MTMKTKLRGALSTGGRLRLWTGLAGGIGVTYAATKIMPDFQIDSDLLYPLPYVAPAAVIGGLMLLSPKTKRAGFGAIGGAAAYYLYAAISNMMGAGKITDQAPPYKAPGDKMPDYISETKGAPVTVMY